MKKKIAMRVASLALCAVFTGMLFGAPKSKAVVADTAIGTAAVASYFQATGLTMAASAGSTGALVTTGIADIAGSYAMATGAASSGSAFLSSVAAGVSISPAGALVLTAAAVVAIGALVAWYVHENGLEEAGDTVVALPGTSEKYLYNGVSLPSFDSIWIDRDIYPYVTIMSVPSNDSRPYIVWFTSLPWSFNNTVSTLGSCKWYFYRSDGIIWDSILVSSGPNQTDCKTIWANYDSFGDVLPDGAVSNQLEILRTPEFIRPDVGLDPESDAEMIIDLGYPSGTTLDLVSEDLPAQIASGTAQAVFELTGAGEGTDTETKPDEETGIYIPILSDIKTRLDSLADSVVDGIMDGLTSLFVPSEAYLEALPERITDTFDERTGFLTYPFSLLPDFVDRLSSSSSDWILRWPQIVEPFSNAVLFQAGSFNVSAFMRNNSQIHYLYELYRLMAKVFMSFGFVSLCYYKYRSVVGDNYGGM